MATKRHEKGGEGFGEACVASIDAAGRGGLACLEYLPEIETPSYALNDGAPMGAL